MMIMSTKIVKQQVWDLPLMHTSLVWSLSWEFLAN